ncbi:lysocardiolipin and lysophospholipid acyltransferase [Nematocida displodere]|uniref:Lysocardiolipin and lysophospholipid acyltransferase n=1 Tax=Nematocida displodere TaxID=1805483 RepID=A0A177EBB1_9MICR|nr:lysocardiolipin and lysophospholipid acyltransferase [Nematocida displodere]
MKNVTTQRLRRLCVTAQFCLGLIFYVLACTVIIPLAFLGAKIIEICGFSSTPYKAAAGSVWLSFSKALVFILVGDKSCIFYDKKLKNAKGKALVISNHISYLDWMFVWNSLLALGKESIIFIAKKDVGVFFLVLGIKLLNFILLDRNIESDKKNLSSACEHMKKLSSYALVLFPEGTFIDRKTHKRDKIYLEKELALKDQRTAKPEERNNHMPVETTEHNHNVLFPRPKGFNLIVNEIGKLDYMINCTLYLRTPNNEFPSEYFTIEKMVQGLCNDYEMVMIYEHEEITPEMTAESASWLYKKFSDKDKLLSQLKGLKKHEIKLLLAQSNDTQYEMLTPATGVGYSIFLSLGSLFVLCSLVFLATMGGKKAFKGLVFLWNKVFSSGRVWRVLGLSNRLPTELFSN